MNTTTASRNTVEQACDQISRSLTEIVAVPESIVERLLIALLAGGHVLIEGIPGIGKTFLARTIARLVDCEFNRIQFTNDLMPSDIVGASIWQPGQARFVFTKGPLFANIVLADEINRTSPRTLSCLLEAMEKGDVTVDGQRYELALPFFVLATRNPIEFHGTYPIPEAALDRFLLRLALEYPTRHQELDLYLGRNPESKLAELDPVISRENLVGLMCLVDDVELSSSIAEYAYRIVEQTREHDGVALGASPRAAMAWLRACKARAVIHGREYVLPDDLKSLAEPVLAHRIFLTGGGSSSPVLARILESTPVQL